MEVEFSSSILLNYLPFLLFFFLVLKIGKSSKSNHEYPKLPPGPWKLPFIGNLHQLVGPLPHRTLRDLAEKYGPLMHLQLGEISTIVVSSPELAKEVTKIHDLSFASRPCGVAQRIVTFNGTDIAFSPYGDYWRQIRKICTMELFSVKRVQSFRSIREEESSNLVKLIASKAGSAFNLTEHVFKSISDIISRAAIGDRNKYQESFMSATDDIMKLLAGFNIADMFPSIELLHSISGVKSEAERLHLKTDEILEAIINERKSRNQTLVLQSEAGKGDEDLVDVLMKFQERSDLEFPLTTDNIKAIILDVFVGGSDTSSTVIVWAMSELMKNPKLMKRAQAEVRDVVNRKGKIDESIVNEMQFLKLIIKETLRLHPPGALLLPRECREKCEINGFDIPIKAKVIVNAWAIGRDPKYWTDPESFNPERFLDCSLDYKGTNFEYMPFGAGRRRCPGMSLGLANVDYPLAMLLYHFDWKLPDGMLHEEMDMTESFGVSVRRKDDLLLIPIPYYPSPVAHAQI